MSDGKNLSAWKYSYWLDNDHLERLRRYLDNCGRAMVRAQQNPCEALLGEIGYAEPHTWEAICRYDAAPWYAGNERRRGKNLVVTSFPLSEDYAPLLATTITPVAFDPPAPPPQEEMRVLARDSQYRLHEPGGWAAFPPEMGEAIVQGLARMQGKEPEKFDELVETWTAVHANFIAPRYRAGGDLAGAPYSIADSAHISSCCVELFNLIDSREKQLLVRPCIGSVIVKALERDRYYRVTIEQ